MRAQTAVVTVAVALVLGGIALASLLPRVPEETAEPTPGVPGSPGQPTAEPGPGTPPGPGTSDRATGALWAVYARTFGASFLNVTLDERRPEVAVVGFDQVDAAGESTRWNETIHLESREIVATTNPRAGAGSPHYDGSVGESTWLYVRPGVAAGDTVQVLGRGLVVERGEDAEAPLPGTWALCADVGCYYYDRVTGLYVHWESEEEPGWTLVETASAEMNARYGAGG